MKRNRLLASGVLGLMLSGSLVACGGSGDSSTTGAAAAPQPTAADQVNADIDTTKVKKSLTVGVDNPYYLFHEDVFMAKELGYFTEVGIDDVKIVETEDPLPGLIGGSLDMALYDSDTAIAAAAKSRSGIKFLSVYLGGEANILGVGKGINTAADLKGKTVTGGQFGSRNDFLIRKLLTDNGVNPDKDVKLVSTGGQSNERLQSVISGTVDGASLQLRHRKILEKAGGKFLFEETAQVPQNGWSASKQLQAQSPETITAFLAATLKARAYIDDIANKDKVLAKAESLDFELPDEYKDAYADENNPKYHTGDGGFEVADFDSFIQTQESLDAVPKGTDWRKYTDLTYLWRAQKHLGLPLRPAPDSIGG